ncbi:MAG: c-type cytochrome [Thermoguttaceae bacterium]
MHYPWWYVPILTSPMLIAFIAVVHVIVSHYAVGGGILIAIENSHALRKNDSKYRDYWKKHTQFFVLLTVAFGAITGVGIWWTIGLASPLATEMLIRTFVFGWAIEWVFFVVEIVAAFAIYYYWDRLPPKTHKIIAWIYAIAAWISLVLITGITAFMLNSKGLMSDWNEMANNNFWFAFFNVQFIPQTIIRTGGALVLSTLYVYTHATWTLRKPEDSELLIHVVRRMSQPLIAGIVLFLVGVALWFGNLSEVSRVVIERAAVLNIFLGLMVGLTAVIIGLTVFGPIMNPKSVNLGFAVSLCIFGVAALGIAEFVREAVRKPYIVDGVVLGNQIYANEVELGRESGGYLQSGLWTELYLHKLYPQAAKSDHANPANDTSASGTTFQYAIDPRGLDPETRIEIGRAIFMYHCNDCHADKHGYSALGPLFFGETREAIAKRVKHLNEPTISMPPWCGTDTDAELLAEYLETIRKSAKQ